MVGRPQLDMLIQGNFNPAHIIRELFLLEYAFSLSWSNENEARVAHRKGVWYLAKLKKGKVDDYFEMDDAWRCSERINPVLYGFLVSQSEHSADGKYQRQDIAKALTFLIHFWVAHLEDIQIVNIVQPGRNASIDEQTGEFDLAPRKDDWKK